MSYPTVWTGINHLLTTVILDALAEAVSIAAMCKMFLQVGGKLVPNHTKSVPQVSVIQTRSYPNLQGTAHHHLVINHLQQRSRIVNNLFCWGQ